MDIKNAFDLGWIATCCKIGKINIYVLIQGGPENGLFVINLLL